MIELLVVIAIIGLLTTIVSLAGRYAIEKARWSRCKAEMKSIATSLQQYYDDHDSYPPDVDRGLPTGLEPYLSTETWPKPNWKYAVYDWDSWIIDGKKNYQISLRFCDVSGEYCSYPMFDWAKDFDRQSSAYYCLDGDANCRSHVDKPENHPGFCINCDDPGI